MKESQLVLTVSIINVENENILVIIVSTLKKNKNCVFCTFFSPIFTFPWRQK